MLQLTFNPGLTITGFRTTRPWVERGSVRVKCFVQEHNTMSPTRARTQPFRSGDERASLEATASRTCTAIQTYKNVLFCCEQNIKPEESNEDVSAAVKRSISPTNEEKMDKMKQGQPNATSVVSHICSFSCK